ncbi:MAG TPA: AGE family epimerase/isomerase, partial [Puia sp.]|nr:AGE family epimerase/isomerase [Puia sp.]
MENNVAAEFDNELTHILNYWEKFTIDHDKGGFYGRLTNDNQAVEGAIKGAVLNARILWSFSAAYNLTKEAHLLKVAERSFDYISGNFLDLAFGGVYWSVTAAGTPADMKKQIYAIAFTIYGLTEFYRASGMEEVLEMAKAL